MGCKTKSTLLKKRFPDCRYFDLLKGEVFERLNRRPEILREELLACEENELIIIDEVQKVPQLLDEVHWLMTNRNLRFILCGSSARKLKRSGANLLGGRAIRNVLFPLVSTEIPNFDVGITNHLLRRKNLKQGSSEYGKAFAEEHPNSRTIVVSNERNKRITGKIEVFPVQEFLHELWKGSIINNQTL